MTGPVMLSEQRSAEAASWGGPRPFPKPMVATDWREIKRHSLRGFFTLKLASGIVLRGCSLHEQRGKRWIALPGAPQIDDNIRRRTDQAGKKLYVPVVEIPDREQRDRFQRLALAAVDRLHEGDR